MHSLMGATMFANVQFWEAYWSIIHHSEFSLYNLSITEQKILFSLKSNKHDDVWVHKYSDIVNILVHLLC